MTHSDLSVIVTGSRGFIGRHLMARLQSEGWDVMEWKDDVRSLAEYDRAIDVVLHLAAAARHDKFATELHEGYDVNVTGTLACLNYCQKTGASCVLTSTSAIYLSPQEYGPIIEEAPTCPALPYSISKWLAENLCRQQAKDMGVPSVVLRLFNVYGPGQHPSFLVPYVVKCLVQSQPLSLRTPEATRDFVYVDDVVDALVRAARCKNTEFRTFNIGSGQATRVIDMVRLAEEVYGEAVGIEVIGPHTGEPFVVVADIGRARQELGWSPQYDLKAGLAAMKASLETG